MSGIEHRYEKAMEAAGLGGIVTVFYLPDDCVFDITVTVSPQFPGDNPNIYSVRLREDVFKLSSREPLDLFVRWCNWVKSKAEWAKGLKIVQIVDHRQTIVGLSENGSVWSMSEGKWTLLCSSYEYTGTPWIATIAKREEVQG